MLENSLIGKSVPRVDGIEKVTGEAIFASDIELPGMLLSRIKRSPYAFAKVLSVNIEKARKLPGVRAVITARNVTQFPYGSVITDELALSDEYVRFVGDTVAAVAAVDEETAEEALDLIEVEYEELAPVFDPEEAMKPRAPAVHPERKDIRQNIAYHLDFVRGEGEAAFKQADVIVEDRFFTQAQYHACMEPQVCIAQWHSIGKLTIWASNQQPFKLRSALASALGIPEHNIRVIQPYVGGAFGGKLYLRPHYVISSLLSRETGKPVKIIYSREEDFTDGRPRISESIDLRLGFRKDGTMLAKSMVITADAGAYCDACPNIINVSLTNPDSVYRLANIKSEANLVYTNKCPRTAFRGYGSPEALFAMESLIDVAAEELGIDPAEIRLKNCSQKGDVTVHGWILNSCGLGESIKMATENSDWKNKKRNQPENHGIGIACQVNVSGQRALHPAYDGSAAVVQIDHYGKVKIISGESELGQGMLTVFVQIAAEELSIDMKDVDIVPLVDSDISPYCIGTQASRVTTLGGNAVLLAARDAKKQLLTHASEKLKINAIDLEIRNGKFYAKGSFEEITSVRAVAYDTVLRKLGGVPITGRGEYTVPENVVIPDKVRYGNGSLAYSFSAQVAEVDVDPETGRIKVLDIWVCEDIGRVLNPELCEGQIEGGVVQGIGYALSENYSWEKGRAVNQNLRDYKIPISADIPKIHPSFIETIDPRGPFGGKGIAEAALNPTAAAIANAVYDAIGVRIKTLPLTPENVLNALKGLVK